MCPLVYVLEPELVHLLYFSPFYLGPLLKVISTGLNIQSSFLYRKCINHIHLLNFLLLSSPPVSALPLSMTVFHSCPLLFSVCSLVSGIFALV
jgi:hypothetical protein